MSDRKVITLAGVNNPELTWQKRQQAMHEPDTRCIFFVSPWEAATLLLIDGERIGVNISSFWTTIGTSLALLGFMDNLAQPRERVHFRFTKKADDWLEFRPRLQPEFWFDAQNNAQPRGGGWRDDLVHIAGTEADEAAFDFELREAARRNVYAEGSRMVELRPTLTLVVDNT